MKKKDCSNDIGECILCCSPHDLLTLTELYILIVLMFTYLKMAFGLR